MMKYKKQMVVLFGICLFVGLLMAEPVFAQQQVPFSEKRVHITNRSIEWRGDSVWIELDIEVSSFSIGHKKQLVLTPLLISDENSKMLPPVILNGKKWHKVYQRSRIYDKKYNQTYYASVNVADKNRDKVVRYKIGMLMEPWMQNVSLVMEQSFCGCENEPQQIYVEMIAQQFMPVSEPKPEIGKPDTAFAVVEPPKEIIERRAVSDQASVFFQASDWAIRTEYSDNREVLDRIVRDLKALTDGESSMQITRLQISAHASPDGGQLTNRAMSWRRAEALATWLKSAYKLQGVLVEFWGEGEDWVMLLKLIREDHSLSEADKQQLEYIIGAVDNPETRGKQMMRYKEGETYHYLLTHIYPKLRRCDYRIEYVAVPP